MNIIFMGAIAIFSYLYGVISYKYEFTPYYQIKWLLNNTADNYLYRFTGNNLAIGKKQIPCSQFIQNTLTILTVGQSNAANSGDSRLNQVDYVYNYNILDNKCYFASDPLLGATGSGGSVWSRLGREMISHGLATKVLFVPIAVSGSSITEWQPDRQHLFPRIKMALTELKKQGINITYIIWQQGESDQSMSTEQYYNALNHLISSIEALSYKSYFFLADSTYCQGKYSEAIRLANRQLIEHNKHVFLGPDIDQYHAKVYRYDDCHLSTIGMDVVANAWLTTIKKH